MPAPVPSEYEPSRFGSALLAELLANREGWGAAPAVVAAPWKADMPPMGAAGSEGLACCLKGLVDDGAVWGCWGNVGWPAVGMLKAKPVVTVTGADEVGVAEVKADVALDCCGGVRPRSNSPCRKAKHICTKLRLEPISWKTRISYRF